MVMMVMMVRVSDNNDSDANDDQLRLSWWIRNSFFLNRILWERGEVPVSMREMETIPKSISADEDELLSFFED